MVTTGRLDCSQFGSKRPRANLPRSDDWILLVILIAVVRVWRGQKKGSSSSMSSIGLAWALVGLRLGHWQLANANEQLPAACHGVCCGTGTGTASGLGSGAVTTVLQLTALLQNSDVQKLPVHAPIRIPVQCFAVADGAFPALLGRKRNTRKFCQTTSSRCDPSSYSSEKNCHLHHDHRKAIAHDAPQTASPA